MRTDVLMIELSARYEEENSYLCDSPQLNEDREGSKFCNGVLMADGVTKRFEAHGKEVLCPEVAYSRREEANESRQLNMWHMLINKFPVSSGVVMFKTREVRKAELEALLEERL